MEKPGFTWLTPVLCVNNLTRSLAHYQEVLGFQVSWVWFDSREFGKDASPTFACVNRGECFVFLCEQGQGRPGSWICMNVANAEDLDAVFAEYQNASADILEPPTDCPWGMREMIVRDLDGNTFRIGCVLEAGDS